MTGVQTCALPIYWDAAREHLAQATEFARALPENGYGNMIRRGIAYLAALPEFIGC